LVSVGERAAHLFGKEASRPKEQPKKKKAQPSLFVVMDEVQEEVKEWEIKAGKIGETVLDRLHQSMILFGAGRGEALRRFLVEDGLGRDQRLWRLAQAFSALYPTGTDEKRWVDGVLARKKGLGF
jgi:putative DNA methylase